jgi:hypothetical protein
MKIQKKNFKPNIFIQKQIKLLKKIFSAHLKTPKFPPFHNVLTAPFNRLPISVIIIAISRTCFHICISALIYASHVTHQKRTHNNSFFASFVVTWRLLFSFFIKIDTHMMYAERREMWRQLTHNFLMGRNWGVIYWVMVIVMRRLNYFHL